EAQFEIDAKLSPNTFKPGLMRIDPKRGKRSRTLIQVAERFTHWTLFRCQPLTGRTHQIRVHLRHAGFPIVADRLYGGRELFLSNLKRSYRLKSGQAERPLLNRTALHAESLSLDHPITGLPLTVTAP